MAVSDVRSSNGAPRAQAVSVTVTTNGKGAVPAVAGGVEVVSNGQVSAALAVGAEVATNGQAATNDESTETLFPQVYQDLAEVEARLRQVIHSKLAVVPEVFLHTVHAGGKRVRPALALLCGRAVGQLTEATFDVAVVSEMIHLASLIHDDVIDNGGRRRARLTANRIWGNK